METSVLQRHQIIKNLIGQSTEEPANNLINLWKQMASQIISIIGDSGFNSLYTRSVFLAQSTFPWILDGSPPTEIDRQFAVLKKSIEGQVYEIAREASALLLITFTDILATLIGEQLTVSILRSAWGDDNYDRADKEFKNE